MPEQVLILPPKKLHSLPRNSLDWFDPLSI